MGSNRKPAHTTILVLTSFALQQVIPLEFVWAPSAFAVTTAPATTGAVASPYSPQGPSFSSLGAGISANFNSCVAPGAGAAAFGAQGSQVQQIANAMNADGSTGGANNKNAGAPGAGGKNAKGGAGATNGSNGKSCPNPVIPDSSSFSCTTAKFEDNSGNFSSSLVENYIKTTLDGTDGGDLTCKKNELDSASKEVSCIAQQGQLLAQQIGSLSGVFQANITRFQQDDQAYKQRIGDRTSQISQINALLNGDNGGTDANGNPIPGTGRKGLLQIAASMKQLTETTLPQAIASAQNTAQSFSNTGNTITQNIQYRTMSLIGNCFKNQPVNGQGYNCVPNGPNVSAMQFLECRYQQYSHVQNGTYNTTNSSNQSAQSAQTNLDAIFQQMFSNTPMSWQLPTDQSSSQAASTASYTATSLSSAEQQYISQLSGITINGVNLAQEADQLLAVCQAQAVAAVQNEQTSPSSYLGQSVEQLYQTGTTNNTNFSSTIQQNANAWTDAMTVLSQQNLPLNLVGCQPNYNSCVSQCSGGNTLTMSSVPNISCVSTCGQTSSAQQVSCLNQLQTQMNALYQGSSSIPAFTMNVTSQFPDTAIPASALQCQGINGCIALLQQRSKEVSTAKTQLTTAEQSYVQQARQSTQQFTTQLSQLLSTQSNALRSQMNSLNTELRTLGISKLTANPITPAELDYDTGDDGKPGLPKIPTNILGLIGGHMSPPMPDVTDPSFGDVDGFQDAEDKVSDQQSKIADLESTLQGLESSCQASNNLSTMESTVDSIAACSNVTCGSISVAQQIVAASLTASGMAQNQLSSTDYKKLVNQAFSDINGCAQNDVRDTKTNKSAIENAQSCQSMFQNGGGNPTESGKLGQQQIGPQGPAASDPAN